MDATLKLAIEDPTVGPEIRKSRITTPVERAKESRLQRIRQKMEAAGALDGESPKAKKFRARLELALDDVSQLLKLEEEFLDEDDRFRLGYWPPDKAFLVHDEAVLITAFIIRHYRPELQRYRIAVVMQKGIPPVARRGRLGTAAKLPGKMTFLSDYQAVVTLDFAEWAMLTDRDRQRLIHHELGHLDRDDEGKLFLRGHDFEDFADVVDLYGLRSESERFSTDGHSADALEHWGAQLELLERAS